MVTFSTSSRQHTKGGRPNWKGFATFRMLTLIDATDMVEVWKKTFQRLLNLWWTWIPLVILIVGLSVSLIVEIRNPLQVKSNSSLGTIATTVVLTVLAWVAVLG